MIKRLSLLMAAVAVVALAVPAFASAAPELTINGKAATKGQTVTGTSTNATTSTSLGLIKCTSVAVHGVVNENTGKTVHVIEDTEAAATAGTGCTVGGKAVTVTGVKLTTLHSVTTKQGTFTAHFSAKIGEVNCSFSTGSGAFTYVSGASPAVITLTNVDLVATPAACEPGTLNGSFTITSTGGTVILH